MCEWFVRDGISRRHKWMGSMRVGCRGCSLPVGRVQGPDLDKGGGWYQSFRYRIDATQVGVLSEPSPDFTEIWGFAIL